MLPTTPTIYRRSEVLAEPVTLNADLGRYTNFVNLLDMSALALPAGFRANSTGFGVSLIAPAWVMRCCYRSQPVMSKPPHIPLVPSWTCPLGHPEYSWPWSAHTSRECPCTGNSLHGRPDW